MLYLGRTGAPLAITGIAREVGSQGVFFTLGGAALVAAFVSLGVWSLVRGRPAVKEAVE
jgi:hypothetical protein